MRFKNTLFAVLTACAAGGTLFTVSMAVHAEDAPSKRQFQAMYDKIAAATKKRDLKPIEPLLASDMTSKGIDGKIKSRAEWLKAIDEQLKRAKSVSACSFTIGSIQWADKKISVESEFHVVAVVTDEKGNLGGAKGQTHTIDEISKHQDLWAKVGGKWRLSSLQEQPGGKVLVDGKPLKVHSKDKK
jgi:hypothetical protein